MSRGLQMLVEEGEHSSCVHAVRTVGKQNLPPFFAEIGVGKQKNRNFLMELAVRSKKIVIFIEKWKKLPVVGRRNAKSPVFYSSLVSETQNYPISTLRSQAKRKITRFLPVARKRNAESLVFYSSLVSETQNRPFSARRS